MENERGTVSNANDGRGSGCVLGVRAEPRGFHWAVVEGTQRAPILTAHDKAATPASFEEPEALAWVRSRVLHVIDTYHPVAVAVRYPEPISRSSNSARQRCRVEGVVLEAAASRRLPILTGPLATIAAKLRTRKPKTYIETGTLRGLDLSSVPASGREAVLIAVAQLPPGPENPKRAE